MPRMIFYGVLDLWTQEVVELFVARAHAERFIAECLTDEPDWRTSSESNGSNSTCR